MVRRKQRAASRSSAGQPASSINEALRALSAGPRGQAGSESGSVDVPDRPGTRMGSRDPAGGLLDSKGVVEGNCVPCEGVAERDEPLDARGYVYASGMGDASDLSSWSML